MIDLKCKKFKRVKNNRHCKQCWDKGKGHKRASTRAQCRLLTNGKT